MNRLLYPKIMIPSPSMMHVAFYKIILYKTFGVMLGVNPFSALMALICLIIIVALLPQVYDVMPQYWGGPTWFNNFASLLVPFSFLLVFIIAVIYKGDADDN